MLGQHSNHGVRNCWGLKDCVAEESAGTWPAPWLSLSHSIVNCSCCGNGDVLRFRSWTQQSLWIPSNLGYPMIYKNMLYASDIIYYASVSEDKHKICWI